MHQHTIQFNYGQLNLLNNQYAHLFPHFESGEGPREQYIAALKKTMQEKLLSQSGLRDFWEQVRNEPQQYHHLHLVYKQKELLNLPWQMAIDEEKYSNVYISKGTEPVKSGPLQPDAGPLQLLVMISSPDDLTINGRLSYEYEVAVIRRALKPLLLSGLVQMDIACDGSLATLQQMLETKKYHVLYFSGHGTYTNDTGYLLLENSISFKCQQVKAQNLGRVLVRKKEHIPSLVILASCQTAVGSSKNGFRGVADQLLHIGVPSVIAMAASVQDRYATLFAKELFEGIIRKETLPLVYGNAIKKIKQAEQVEYAASGRSDASLQWLIPQLYFSRVVEHIVDWEQPAAATKTVADPVKAVYEGGRFLFMHHDDEYYFLGRRRECARIQQALYKNKPVLLKGEGGVGKTAMAEEMVKRLISGQQADHYFAFDETSISLHNMALQMEEYLETQHDYYIDVDEFDDDVERLNFLFQEVSDLCHPIWIFDHLDTCQQYAAGPLQEEYLEWITFVKNNLINRFPIIFTSRFPIVELEDIVCEDLSQVKFEEFYLKCCQLQMRDIELLNPDISFGSAAYLLFTALGGNYRAVELFDEIYKKNPQHIAVILDKLQDSEVKDSPQKNPLKELTATIEAQMVAEGSKLLFSELLQLLNATEVELLQLLTYFRKPVLAQALEKQTGRQDVEEALQHIYNLSLVEMQPGNLYYVTPLVRDWLAEHPTADVHFSHDLAGDYYKYCEKYIDYYSIGNLEEAFHHFVLSGNIDELNKTGLWLTDYFYEVSATTKVFYYASKVAEVASDKIDVFVLYHLAKSYWAKGEAEEAIEHFGKVLSISRAIKNKALEGSVLNYLSVIYKKEGEMEMAREFFEKSQVITDLEDITEKEGCMRYNNILYYASMSVNKPDPKAFELTLVAARNANFTYGEAVTWNNWGLYYATQFQWKDAKDMYTQAFSLLEDMGDSDVKAELLFNWGLSCKELGRDNEAMEHLNHSLFIYKNIGHKTGKANVLNVIAQILITEKNRAKEAVKLLKEGLAIRRQQKNKTALMATLINLSQAYAVTGDKKNALECDHEAGIIMKATMGLFGTKKSYENKVVIYYALRDIEKAREFAGKAAALEKKLDWFVNEPVTISNQAALLVEEGKYEDAIGLLIVSARQKEEQSNFIGVAETYLRIATYSHKIKKYQDYITYMLKAYGVFKDEKEFKGMYDTGKRIGYFLITSEILNDDKVLLDFHEGNSSIDDKTKLAMKMMGLDILEDCALTGHKMGFKDAAQIDKFINLVKKGKI